MTVKTKTELASTVKRGLDKLKPHPRNEEIYGENEDISELKEKIRKSGVVTTLIITDDDVIVSGNRRWKSCKQLVSEGDKRFCQVNCEIKTFDNEEDELEYLVICNDTREKTREQKAREAQMLLEVERERARKRQATSTGGAKPQLIPKPGEAEKSGKSNDKIAKKLHIRSGHEVDRMVKSVRKIDELQKQGRETDSELIRNTLNNTSASTAEELAKHIDEMSEEDKQAIRDNKISAYKAACKYAASKSKETKPDMTKEERERLEHKQACKEAVEEYIAISLGLKDIPDEPNENRGRDAVNFLDTASSTFETSLNNLKNSLSVMTKEEKTKAVNAIKSVEQKIKEIKKIMEVK